MAAGGDRRVAVIADAHFHDPSAFLAGAGVDIGGERLALRSWTDTVAAPRAVNESAGLLRAALQMIRARGVRHVVLLGDYTDDGQRVTTARLAALLHAAGDLRFYAIPGNHDVYALAGKHTATRYADGLGGTRLVTSDPVMAAAEGGAIADPGLYCDGMPAGLAPMASFGLKRGHGMLHWETPFGASDSADDRQALLHSADGATAHRLMDASYLVEPVADLWLLMIDANVFEPRNGITDPARKRAFLDPADAGWTALLRVKPYLTGWISDVARRAARQDKTLIALSHYPALDPHEDHDRSETALFGDTDVARRSPAPAVAEALAAAGIGFHVSGHLHAAGLTRQSGVVQLALPSLAAWPPAFAILHPGGALPRIETVSLAALPLDPRLAAFYRDDGGFDPAGPEARSVGAFLLAQARARAVRRILPQAFPGRVAAWMAEATTADLTALLAPGARGPGPALPLTALVADWHVLRFGGPLAPGAIGAERLALWQAMAARCGDAAAPGENNPASFLPRFLAVMGRTIRRATRPQTA